MTGWQPIETAPKDGTSILVWTRDYLGAGPACAIVRWEQSSAPQVRYVPVAGDLFRQEVFTPGIWKSFAYSIQPTHWMELPAPPEDAQ